MGRRMTNAELSAVGVLIVLALVVVLPIAGLIRLGNTFGWPVMIGKADEQSSMAGTNLRTITRCRGRS
jgi:lauroyl/myristoyl acyltransferase